MPRADVKDKRKAQLIAAALDSIAKRGLVETTITHIAKGANMSRGIINFYFDSKEIMMREALKSLIDDYQAAWRHAQSSLKDDDAHARILALIDVHFSKKLCQAKRLNVMSAFWGHAASQVAYRTQLEAADVAIERAFTEMLAHYEQTSLEDATHHARQLHALIRGLWLSFMLNPQHMSRESLAMECYGFIDRLTGAPVRIVRDNPPNEARVSVSPPKKKASKKEKTPSEQNAQMDIEDLFG
jgi:TetR/AcrR family transcriptional repressor of bet genes